LTDEIDALRAQLINQHDEIKRLTADLASAREQIERVGIDMRAWKIRAETAERERDQARAQCERMRAWAKAESEHWDGRNSDRYWQMQRVLRELDKQAQPQEVSG
jgi:chromosome segregation ATPase